MKKTIAVFIITYFSFALFGISGNLSEKSAVAYRDAFSAYEAQNFGQALKLAEDAIYFRKEQAESEIKVLNTALSPRSVQKAGDSIYQILKVLKERNDKNAINIINDYIKRHGEDIFSDSITKLLQFINDTKEFPEAQKLIGDVYKMEGEYEFAEKYYLQALENKEVLDIPDEKYEIYYTLAELSELQNDKEKMEVRLLNIISADSNYKDGALNKNIRYTIMSNKDDSLEKLFLLFRANSYYCLKAYNKLADYYYNCGEYDKAFEFGALSAVTGFTKFYEILEKRDVDFNYENLPMFLSQISYYPDLVEWGSEHDIWKSFNGLAFLANEAGCKNFATRLLKVLCVYTPVAYWQQDAVLQLSKISKN